MLKYKDFLNENNKEVWEYDGDFEVDEYMINDGRFIEGKIPTIVTGSFNCSDNNLTSLEGGPNIIRGHFYCSYNQLTSLLGGPNIIRGHFYCSNNMLTSLEGVPKEVGGNFKCSNNKLTSLEGSPEKINGYFWCAHNQLTSLEGCPSIINGSFDCMHNKLISLERGPKEVLRLFYCGGNKNNLTTEKNFIKSGSFKQDFYIDLLNYCLKNTIDLEKIKSWPENFLSDNIKTSAKGINKFKL